MNKQLEEEKRTILTKIAAMSDKDDVIHLDLMPILFFIIGFIFVLLFCLLPRYLI